MPPDEKIPQKPVCSTCGSEEVRRDAYASWNTKTQEWELITTFDNTDCEQCGGQCSLEWINHNEA